MGLAQPKLVAPGVEHIPAYKKACDFRAYPGSMLLDEPTRCKPVVKMAAEQVAESTDFPFTQSGRGISPDHVVPDGGLASVSSFSGDSAEGQLPEPFLSHVATEAVDSYEL